MDQTAQHLARLSPFVRWQAEQFINDLRLAGYPAVITSSTRTQQEQRTLLQQGRSTTLTSRHLTGRAFDVDMYGWNRDRVPGWVWDSIGPYGEQHGLVWGGRWKSFRDVGHFEV